MTSEPPLVTLNVSLPDGAVAADRLHSSSVASTVTARSSPLSPSSLADDELSVQAASAASATSDSVTPAALLRRDLGVVMRFPPVVACSLVGERAGVGGAAWS